MISFCLKNIFRADKTALRTAVLLPLLIMAAGCGKGIKVNPLPAVPVLAAKAEIKDMPLQIVTFGNVDAYSEVPIRSMVTGRIQKIAIKPGQYVKKGDLLIEIDSRTFAATLKQLQATQARDEVLYNDMERQAQMKEALLARGAGAKDETKRIRAQADSAQAIVDASRANVDKARVDLEECTIRSPLDGRVGDLLIYSGTIVKADEGIIVNIAQTQPIYVAFSVPQAHLPLIQKYMREGKLYAEVKIPSEAGGGVQRGELTFVDNNVSTTSGTVRLKATFPNTDNLLWPGQFVNVTLTLTVDKKRIVVPSHAVQSGQEGSYVFVVGADNTVAVRNVTVERSTRQESIINTGLKGNENIVTDGHIRLYPGARVTIANGLVPPEEPTTSVPKK